jgi:isopenicillin-N epimerase
MMAPKGSAFISAALARHSEIRPLVTSHGSGQGFHADFDWVRTRDPTALVETAARELATQWKTEVGSPAKDSVAMKTVRLPLSRAATQEAAQGFRALLFRDHRMDVVVVAFAGSLWTRISAQAYNSLPEYRLFAAVVRSRRNPPGA